MTVSRRVLFAQILLVGAASLALPRQAAADEVIYRYDVHGRLKSVTYPNGVTINYMYDAAGNRIEVEPSSGTFGQTIAITGTSPVNLRSLANAAGYNGAQHATVTFEVNNGAVITGGGVGGIGVDSGTWPTDFYTITLTLKILTGGTVYGGGGMGGLGAGSGNATAGGAGGDAIHCRLPMSVTVNSGGVVKGGGGGGGGGGGFWKTTDPERDRVGGGGGGGFPNGLAGSKGTPILDGSAGTAANGSPGTISGGGAGGAGESGTPSGGAGGAGGGPGVSGGGGLGGSGSSSGWIVKTNGGIGPAGYAIRKNGHIVTVTNNGTLTGAVG